MTLPQIVIPMAGQGQRFAEAGYALPKPLIPVAGVPMVVRAVLDLVGLMDRKDVDVQVWRAELEPALAELRTLNPGKTFIEAPTAGNSATCKSCAHCPWMAMNGLAGVARVLESGVNEVFVDPALGLRARLPIDRMLAFTAALKNGQPTAGLVPHIGAA